MYDSKSIYYVSKAVKAGDIPHISTQSCVDCGKQAAAYDHRDYNKPLDVEPVCKSCNYKRGAAIPRVGIARMDILHIEIPAGLKHRVKMRAVKEKMTMREWVILRLTIGLKT